MDQGERLEGAQENLGDAEGAGRSTKVLGLGESLREIVLYYRYFSQYSSNVSLVWYSLLGFESVSHLNTL